MRTHVGMAMTFGERQAFAERLRKFRRKYGVTQRELAKRWSLGPWTIPNMEKCLCEPYPRMITRLDKLEQEYAAAAELETEELMGTS